MSKMVRIYLCQNKETVKQALGNFYKPLQLTRITCSCNIRYYYTRNVHCEVTGLIRFFFCNFLDLWSFRVTVDSWSNSVYTIHNTDCSVLSNCLHWKVFILMNGMKNAVSMLLNFRRNNLWNAVLEDKNYW